MQWACHMSFPFYSSRHLEVTKIAVTPTPVKDVFSCYVSGPWFPCGRIVLSSPNLWQINYSQSQASNQHRKCLSKSGARCLLCLVWRLQLPWSTATHTSPEKARLEVLIILSLGISLCVYVIFTDNSAFGKYNTQIEEKTGLLNSSRALHAKNPYRKYLLPKIVSLSLTYFI